MTNHKLSARSKRNLVGTHPDLQRLVDRALQLSPYDFGIGESTVRTAEQHTKMLESGASTTKNSRHLPENNACGLSCAVDIFVFVRGQIAWGIKHFRKVGQAFVTAAIELGIQIELGMLWESFVDGPHIQLSWEYYP